MRVEATIAGIRARIAEARGEGKVAGLVPTMGALHAGHGALIERARRECGYVVVSIFVNPIQFNQEEDFSKYPRTLEADLELCRSLGADAMFAPEPQEMYPQPVLTKVEVAQVSEGLCGEFRPGHFQGVATVVAKLFHIMPVQRAYFGEKDAQQLAVIQRMVADLNFDIEIVPVATVREADGLAMSSRNVRLSAEDRRIAPVLYQALRAAADRIGQGVDSASGVRQAALDVLARAPEMRVEYLEIVDARTMQTVKTVRGPVRIAAAVWLGRVRLIDNVAVGSI